METLYWWRRRGIHDRMATHMGVIYDASRRNWRHDVFPDYKANRPDLDDDLQAQMPLMRTAATEMGLCVVEEPGYEADDLIGTYALTVAEQGARCLIVAADKDLLQLVQPSISVFDPPAGVEGFTGFRPARYFANRDDVIDKFGVPPELVTDFQALAGDSSDGVPGVPQIGRKRAVELLHTYGSLEGVLAAAPEMKKSRIRDHLIEHADLARVCRQVVRLDCLADYTVPIEDMRLEPFDLERALAFAQDIGLPSVVRTLERDINFAGRVA